ncbi:hypothetical protein AQUCO_00200801v1 [Aquilegia coerulea]|uniref:Uncharacterized protein n=1 Tax=Aquilegia coerulea TaxID=218851 RepID=A0A2G5F4T9_AQUCA|nr:hypothetical protein AQUCO_00200801v1 [Aquilegia coerulea]
MTSSSNNQSSGHERACRLTNTIHSEVVPCLPLPSLPVFCGSNDQDLRLFDESTTSRSLDRNEVVSQASRIADLLKDTDVSYLNLRDGPSTIPHSSKYSSILFKEVLQNNSAAFECSVPAKQMSLNEPVTIRSLGVRFVYQP